MRRILASVSLVCLVLLFAASAFGQTGNASLGGVVQDPSKALIPGVTVKATDINTNVVTSTITNDSGSYNFPTLLPGTYKVSAELPGFKTAINTDLRLGTSAQALLNFTLELGQTGTSVEVSVNAQTQLTESSASVGEVLTEDRIRALPTVGNNVLDLLEVLPGFRVSSFGAQFDTIQGLGLNSINTTINGLSTTNTRYDAQTYGYDVFTPTVINPDLVGEIRLILSPVDAEYGRGNAQVQIQTRSGTNKYTGSAVWNIQNTGMNANSWANNHAGTIQNGVFIPNNNGWRNTHQITASYGGPIIKSKTFFFALWDQQITNTREPQNISVMTDTARQGIFRYWTGWNPTNALAAAPTTVQSVTTATYPSVNLDGTVRRPLMNPDTNPYTGNLVCFSVFGNKKFDGSPFTQQDCPDGVAAFNSANPSLWDANRPVPDKTGYMARIISLMPRANYFAAGDGLNNAQFRYIRGRSGSNSANAIVGAVLATGSAGASADYTNRKQINIKIDENLNAKNRFNISWQSQWENSADNVALWPVCDASGLSCSVSPLNGQVRRSPQVWTVNGTSTISASLINEARFGVQHTVTNSQNAFTNSNSAIANEAKSFLVPGGVSTLTGQPYQVTINPGVGNFNGGPLNVGAEIGNISPLWSYGDTLSWSHGKHAFKVGGELRLPRTNGYNIQALPQVTMGNATNNTLSPLNSSATSLAGDLPGFLFAGAAGATSARANAANLAYTLAGSVSSVLQPYWIENASDVANGTWQDTSSKGRRYREQVSSEWDIFVKDDFKMTRHLTLNLGIRYEAYNSPYIRSGLTSSTLNNGNGLFGVALPDSGSNFGAWGAPGNLFLSGYGSKPELAGLAPLGCTTGAPQNALLPAPNCDINKTTQIIFVGPKSPNPGKTAIPNRGDFGPAIGFAWQLPWFGEGKTQIRGGYQITYGGASGNGIALDTLLGNSPGSTTNPTTTVGDFTAITSTRSLDLTDIAGNPGLPSLVPVRPTRAPGAAIPIYGQSIGFEAYDKNYVSPYTENFTLSVTRNVNRKMTVDIKYVGTIGKKQQGNLNLNTVNVFAKGADGNFLNQELYDALVTTRAGGDAPLFDQMLAGLNLNPAAGGGLGLCQGSTIATCYGPVGSLVTVNGVPTLQHGSAHLRRSGTFAANLANGNFVGVVNSLIASTFVPTGLQAAPLDPASTLTPQAALGGLGARALRNGCDRLANGYKYVQETGATPGTFASGFNALNSTQLRCFPENYFMANPQFQTATYDANLGHTNYQSVQFQTTVRPIQGTSIQSTFTWAKSMSLSATSYNNPWDRNDDYSRAINTTPYEFRSNGTFELPMGPNKLLFGGSSGWFARAVEKWQTSVIFNLASGLPRTFSGNQLQYVGAGGNGSQPRPNIVGPWETPETKLVWNNQTDAETFPGAGQGNYAGNPNPYTTFADPQCKTSVGATDTLGLNLQPNCTILGLGLVVPQGTPGSFISRRDPVTLEGTQWAIPLLANPTPGYQGNLGAYTGHTVGKISFDANASKSFRITESKTLQIRVDSKNILNHPQVSDPTGFTNGSVLANNFGRVNAKGTGSPRTFQAQLRITF